MPLEVIVSESGIIDIDGCGELKVGENVLGLNDNSVYLRCWAFTESAECYLNIELYVKCECCVGSKCRRSSYCD